MAIVVIVMNSLLMQSADVGEQRRGGLLSMALGSIIFHISYAAEAGQFICDPSDMRLTAICI